MPEAPAFEADDDLEDEGPEVNDYGGMFAPEPDDED